MFPPILCNAPTPPAMVIGMPTKAQEAVKTSGCGGPRCLPLRVPRLKSVEGSRTAAPTSRAGVVLGPTSRLLICRPAPTSSSFRSGSSQLVPASRSTMFLLPRGARSSGIGLRRTKLGAASTQFGAVSTKSGPNLGGLRQNLSQLGANMSRVRPHSSHFDKISVGKLRPNSDRCRPNLGHLDQTQHRFDRCWADSYQMWGVFAQVLNNPSYHWVHREVYRPDFIDARAF